MSNNIELKINGLVYDGWLGVSVNKSLFNMTGTFGLSGTDIFPEDFTKWGFSIGDECKIEIDNQTIVNGYIEEIPISYDSEGHDIQISGRDKTCDLVDCSFIETTNEWKGRSIAQIITALCDPFGIDVVVDDSVSTEANQEPKETFKAQMGMTIFEMIRPMLDIKGILPVSYADGKLTLTRTGIDKTNDSLELGKNILSGSINQSFIDRFNLYIVKGQGIGNDDKDVPSYTGPEGQYEDEVILRYRPIIILPDNEINSSECVKRAKWEATNRAGQSTYVDYVVQGWIQSNGDVWPLNSLVQVKDSFLGINSTMLIASVLFECNNDSGKITRLSLVSPETFDYNPTRNTTKEIQSKSSWTGL